VWDERRAALRAVIDTGSDPELLRLGDAARAALDRYAAAATQAGAAFVEIQSTLLFATIAQRAPSGG
jgi:hypothetical protein